MAWKYRYSGREEWCDLEAKNQTDAEKEVDLIRERYDLEIGRWEKGDMVYFSVLDKRKAPPTPTPPAATVRWTEELIKHIAPHANIRLT